MIQIVKPKLEDIPFIKSILLEWTVGEESNKYIDRINNEINGSTDFSMSFWIIKKDDIVIGVGGLSNILPLIKSYSKTKNPGELKILYLANTYRGQGFGKIFLIFLEKKAKESNYTELMIRSALKYKNTAYGFYESMGYEKLGVTENDMTVFSKQI